MPSEGTVWVQTKMSVHSPPEEQPRPHQRYKREWLEQVLSGSPGKLLDVGCGTGELLQAVASKGGWQCTGLELDDNAIATCRSRGLDVRAGRAEALPFPNESFDVVTFDYVAHHVEHLGRALLEAARVARRGVFVLDPWFDTTIPSQQVALDFDNWSKAIDRRCGWVHSPCVGAAELAQPYRLLGGFHIEYSYRLILQAVPPARISALGRLQLERIAKSPELEAQLQELLDRARLHGFSDDGALSFSAVRI